MKLTVLYDNRSYIPDFESGWGFSCLIRLPEATILFDTGGDGPTLLGNMKQLLIEPEEVDIIFRFALSFKFTLLGNTGATKYKV